MMQKALKIEAKSRAIRVLSVDDHDLLIDGLRSRFDHEDDIEFVGKLSTADGLTYAAKDLNAEVVLLDLEMPGPDPFDAIGDLLRMMPHIKVIVLSAHIRDHYVDEATKAGAWGYLSKNDDVDEIVDAVRRVMKDQFVFGSSVVDRCQIDPGSGKRVRVETPSKLGALSNREMEVLRMIGRGMGRKEIATQLSRSPRTIDNHRASIMRKLEITDRVELVRYAIREGLVEV